MNWQGLILDGYKRIPEFMHHILDGLQQEDLNWQPHPDSNSIGWTLWHLTRQQDAQVAALMEKEQLWILDNWYVKFNRTADVADTGFGHTPAQVAEFKSPDARVFIEYQEAAVERSINYINSLSDSDLDRELNEPWFQPLPTLGIRLVSILGDSLMHAGQAAYIRGLRQGKGWQSY